MFNERADDNHLWQNFAIFLGVPAAIVAVVVLVRRRRRVPDSR